jgi:hypothetical protein
VVGSVYAASVHAMFSGKQKKRCVQLVGVSGTSRRMGGRSRGFVLNGPEEDHGAAAFVAQRGDGSGSGWQLHF